jgi:hypothetical protein
MMIFLSFRYLDQDTHRSVATASCFALEKQTFFFCEPTPNWLAIKSRATYLMR